MIHTAKVSLSLVVLGLALTRPSVAADLTLTVSNISESAGIVYWSIFDSAEGYQADTSSVLSARSRVSADALRVTVHDLPAGRYAVKLYHDANGNGELDSNMLGIPVEGYGFSNNGGRFGPPSFEEAAVTVENDTQIGIRLR